MPPALALDGAPLVDNSSGSLDTRLDAAFGILGAILIISGLALAITGSAYKRLSVFIVTAYTMATVTMALILHFGVERQINSPSTGIRVAFVIGSLAAGVVSGIGAVVFHRGARVLIAPVAGFLFGLVLQSVRNDGLIKAIGPRYLLFLGLSAALFIAGLFPRYFDMVLLLSTSFLGALAFAIGVDCFTTAGLKEFLVLNLGFRGVFSRLDGHFQISGVMQIELGLIALVFCISVAVQIRLFNLFEKRLARLLGKTKDSEKKLQEEEEAARRISGVMNGDVEKFEHRYSRRFPFAIPASLPAHPDEAHFDKHSPELPRYQSNQSPSLNTPRSDSSPLLLPALGYERKGDDNRNKAGLAIKTSESNKSFFSQMKSFMHTEDGNKDIPPVPVLSEADREALKSPASTSTSHNSNVRPSCDSREAGSKGDGDPASLAEEIADREKALKEIQVIRQSIDQMRTRIRSGSQSDAIEGSTGAPTRSTDMDTNDRSASPPAPARPNGHRHSVSFNELPGDARRTSTATFAAPRPISRYSMITVQQTGTTPASQAMHGRSASQNNVNSARPLSVQHLESAGVPSRRLSGMPAAPAASRTMSSGSVQQVQRVVTGVMPARPAASHAPPPQAGQKRQSLPRTQTMDIIDLDARHRRRLSELQGGATTGKLSLDSARPAASGPRPATNERDDSSRKRSSTMANLASVQDHPPHRQSGGVDELGRRTQVERPTMVASASVHVMQGAKTGVSPPAGATSLPSKLPSLDAAKKSEGAWLSY